MLWFVRYSYSEFEIRQIDGRRNASVNRRTVVPNPKNLAKSPKMKFLYKELSLLGSLVNRFGNLFWELLCNERYYFVLKLMSNVSLARVPSSVRKRRKIILYFAVHCESCSISILIW